MRQSEFAKIHMNDGFRSVDTYRAFFRSAIRDIKARHAAYEAEVKAWYETGDGRPISEGGHGYAFPECIHGSSLWTDYDNICGWCEDSSTILEEAIVLGRERWLRFVSRWEWVTAAPPDLNEATRREMLGWAMEAWPRPPERV